MSYADKGNKYGEYFADDAGIIRIEVIVWRSERQRYDPGVEEGPSPNLPPDAEISKINSKRNPKQENKNSSPSIPDSEATSMQA